MIETTTHKYLWKKKYLSKGKLHSDGFLLIYWPQEQRIICSEYSPLTVIEADIVDFNTLGNYHLSSEGLKKLPSFDFTFTNYTSIDLHHNQNYKNPKSQQKKNTKFTRIYSYKRLHTHLPRP